MAEWGLFRVTFALRELDQQVRKYNRLRAVLEKLRATHSVKKFPAFHGTWNLKVLYDIHKNLPLYHMLNHKDAGHFFIISSIKSILILSYVPNFSQVVSPPSYIEP